jgi:hypothetical protein
LPILLSIHIYQEKKEKNKEANASSIALEAQFLALFRILLQEGVIFPP